MKKTKIQQPIQAQYDFNPIAQAFNRPNGDLIRKSLESVNLIPEALVQANRQYEELCKPFKQVSAEHAQQPTFATSLKEKGIDIAALHAAPNLDLIYGPLRELLKADNPLKNEVIEPITLIIKK